VGYAGRVLFGKVPQTFCRAILAASANDQYIKIMYIHNLVKPMPSRALWDARTSYKQYIGAD
jgi:hypothetical protein